MSKNFLKVLKEIGIVLLLLIGALVACVFVFIYRIPIGIEVPEPEVYVLVDRDDYLVETGGIENAQSETVVHQSTSSALETYAEEYRYTSGKTEPLTNPNPTSSDIPTDIISR